jgi:rhodanese-related sulfurtransferase
MNNLALVAVFLASGAMLLWPEISRLAGASNELGTFEATRLINQGPHLVLDVGDAAEFATGHLPKARNIPIGELAGRLDEIGKYKDKPVLVVTAKGPARAGAACRLLKRSGFANVYQLKGGTAAWEQASLPVEK